jgi:NADH:ubiquinone oxidoreductase subunit E
MNEKLVLKALGRHGNERKALIAILEDLQSKYGYLPEDALRILSKESGIPLADIYSVATFYRAFSLKPRGRHLVSVCLGTACHVRGGKHIAEEFQKQLGVRAGETTGDKQFSLETVNCLGACALGPIVVVDGHYFSKVWKRRVKEILDRTVEGLDKVSIKGDRRIFPLTINCPRCNHSLMDQHHRIDGFPSVRVTASFGRFHGWLRLSSLYGSYTFDSEHEIPMETIVNFFCPHCHAELVSAWNCPECGAPMVPMTVSGGAIGQICSRRGCRNHMLDISETTIG